MSGVELRTVPGVRRQETGNRSQESGLGIGDGGTGLPIADGRLRKAEI